MNNHLSSIHADAKIGDNVTIESFVTIQEDVIIGDGTWIGPNAVIMNGARIGKNCQIHPGAVIAGTPQDKKFDGEYTTVVIGDNTSIREFATINRGTKAKDKTIIGNNCLIMSYGHVAHDCIIGNGCIIGSYAGLAGEVEMDDFAILSPGSLVHQFCRIGAHVMIQGGSKVVKDVPPYCMAGREPLAYTGVNSVGLRRRGFSNDSINQILDIYRIIYHKGMNVTQALEFIEGNIPVSKEKEVIVEFIGLSKRGIIRSILDSRDTEE